MSEKRSWDVQRKPQPKREIPQVAPVKAEPTRVATKRIPQPVEPVRKAPAKPAPAPASAPVIHQAPRRAKPLPAGTLRERRRKKRRVMRYVVLALLAALLAAGFYCLWLPAFRIQTVTAHGPNAAASIQIAQSRLPGTYAYILPRNSVFFFPTQKIRAAILDAEPDVSAVSITRTSFTSIEIGMTPRAASFLWCGTSIDTPNPDGSCYDADIEGLIFAQDSASTTVASSTTTTGTHVNSMVRVFSGLDREVAAGQSPLRAHVLSYSRIPDILKFVDAIRQLGAPVSSVGIRGDEADLWVSGPTRITYVIGHEQEAAALAASALPSLTLTDGTIKYVDLRFAGKAYVARY